MNAEERVRLYEGHTEKVQLELWPRPVRRADRRDMLRIIVWLVASIVLSAFILYAMNASAMECEQTQTTFCT